VGEDEDLDVASIDSVVAQLMRWLDSDEPMVEAIGNTLAKYHRCDSQEQARQVLSTVVDVLERHADAIRR
jgi:hypothetical protein